MATTVDRKYWQPCCAQRVSGTTANPLVRCADQLAELRRMDNIYLKVRGSGDPCPHGAPFLDPSFDSRSSTWRGQRLRPAKAAAQERIIMSTVANTDGLEEKGETRVMGLGVGVFLIVFFSMVATVVCLVGATTPRPG